MAAGEQNPVVESWIAFSSHFILKIVLRTQHEIDPLNRNLVHGMVLLSIDTALYSRSLEPTHLAE